MATVEPPIHRAFAELAASLALVDRGASTPKALAAAVAARRAAIAAHLGGVAASPELTVWKQFVEDAAERIAIGGDTMLVQAALAEPEGHPASEAAEVFLRAGEFRKPYLRLLNRPSAVARRRPVEVYGLRDMGGVALALHPDGQHFVVAAGNEVSLYRRGEAAPVRTLATGHRGAVYSLAVHPDGRRVLTGCLFDGDGAPDGRVLAFDLSTGKRVAVYEHKGNVRGAFFDLRADGRYVVAAGGPLRLWDVEAGGSKATKPQWVIAGDYAMVAFHPDGESVLAYTQGRIEQRKTEGGALIRSFTLFEKNPPGGHVRPAVMRDGRRGIWAFEGADGFADVDLERGALQGWITGHTNDIESLAFSADERRVLTASQDGTFRLWDFETGDLLHVQSLGGRAVGACAFVDDERRVLATTLGGRTSTWELEPRTTEPEPPVEDESVKTVVFAQGRARALSLGAGRPLVWSTRDGTTLAALTLEGAEKPEVAALAADGTSFCILRYDPRQLTLVAVDTASVVGASPLPERFGLWRDAEGSPRLVLEPTAVETTARIPGGVLLRAKRDSIAVLMADGTGTVREVPRPSAWPHASHLVCADGGRWVVTTTLVRTVRIYDVDAARIVLEVPFPEERRLEEPSALGVAPIPGAASAYVHGRAGDIHVVDLRAGTVSPSALLSTEPIHTVDVSPSHEVAIQGPKSLRIHDAKGGGPMLSFVYPSEIQENAPSALAWTSDSTLATLHGGRLHFFRVCRPTPGP